MKRKTHKRSRTRRKGPGPKPRIVPYRQTRRIKSRRGGAVAVPGCGVLSNEEYQTRANNGSLYESCNPRS